MTEFVARIENKLQLARFADYMGASVVLARRLYITVINTTVADVREMVPNGLANVGAIVGRCAPVTLFYAWLTGVFTAQYIPHVAAPGLLVTIGLTPVSLLISGLIFMQREGVEHAETYAVDTRESGFQYLLDIGLHPLKWIVIPKIISTSFSFAILSATASLMILFGISPTTVLGMETHPAIPFGITKAIFSTLVQGYCFGLWFGFAAFLAGVVGDSDEPGSAASRFIAFAAYVLGNIVFIELFPWK
ncbi:MAG: hypothetical protein JKX97_06835 [Candidatus Lindowbacteria bacterium]|nr:hypothetical protein [Candidatus Lindowbacteria bacterium]